MDPLSPSLRRAVSGLLELERAARPLFMPLCWLGAMQRSGVEAKSRPSLAPDNLPAARPSMEPCQRGAQGGEPWGVAGGLGREAVQVCARWRHVWGGAGWGRWGEGI